MPQVTRRSTGRWGFAVLASLGLSWLPSAVVLDSSPPLDQGRDIRVNQPGEGEFAPNCNTQNEVSVARFETTLVAGWVDGGQCDFLLAATGLSHGGVVSPLLGSLSRDTGVSLSGYGFSTDGGATWTDGGVIEPAEGGSVWGDPVLAADADGTFYYATLAFDAAGRSVIGVARSLTMTEEAITWSMPVDASPGRAEDAFQDKPWMAVDTTGSPYHGTVYVAWTEFAPDGKTMLLSRSLDGGTTFRNPVELPVSDACGTGIGVQVAVGPHGEVYVVWVDDFGHGCFQASVDGGVTFTAADEFVNLDYIGDEQRACLPKPLPDPETVLGTAQDDPVDAGVYVLDRVLARRFVLNGDIRVYEWPSLAVDTTGSADPGSPDFNPYHGRIYVAVPHSPGPFDPITQIIDYSDVYLVHSSDQGRTWAGVAAADEDLVPTNRVHDDPIDNGQYPDQFHPQVAVGTDGTVAVTWYDRRLSNPARPNWELDLFATVSFDGGETFAPNLRVSDVSSPPAQTNPNSNGLSGCYMGEYNGLVATPEGEFLAVWGDNRDLSAGLPDPNIYLDRIIADAS